MIDKWFENDVNRVLSQHQRLVITDAQGEGRFLLGSLPESVVLLEVAEEELSEIEARYKAEHEYRNRQVVFYTTQRKGDLTFLLEYAETNGCVELDDMEQYIKEHLFAETHENTELGKDDLLMAAKLSKGRDLNWWQGVCKGLIPAIDIHQLLTDLLRYPKEMKAETDKDVWKVFAAEVYSLIGKPQTEQPAEVMAQTVMDEIFTGLLNNNITQPLLKLYYLCTDSSSMTDRMAQYINNFSMPKEVSALDAHPDHPFAELDKRMFIELSKTLENGGFTEKYMHVLNLRIGSIKATNYKPAWLKDLKTLLGFKHKGLHLVSNMNELAAYYEDVFAELDSAIRHLYVAWLHDENVIRPYQYLYEQQNKELLDKWFSLSEQYKPTQQGILQDELNGSERTAVIVCDGLRLEIAAWIARQMKSKKNKKKAFAMLPSVTENGMSALFGCQNVETDDQKRFKHLQSQMDGVQVIKLEKLNRGVTANKLILMFGDIDQLGEKKQMAALKDINAYEGYLTEKINELQQTGYKKVVLTTDHGFVITGILDEADKVDVPEGIDKVEERFCQSKEPIRNNKMIERSFAFSGSNYQQYARTDKPFKTKGPYGYSHGGYTPQECIIPVYEFYAESAQEALEVSICNKKDLKAVTGNHFVVRLKAKGNNNSIFQQEREIMVQLYENDTKQGDMPAMKIKADGELEFKYQMPASGKAKVVVVDAQTQKQIDFCDVEKQDTRGLDGLL